MHRILKEHPTKPWLKRLLSVFSLVSRIPVRLDEEPDFSRADLFLPVVGCAAGLTALAAYWLADLVFLGPIPPAIAAIVAQYLAFNLFHFDGLLDSADALFPSIPRERRFEILKDPRAGSYAVFAGVLVILARVGALSEPSMSTAAALLAAPVVGRTAAVFVSLAAHPAKDDGLGAVMQGMQVRETILGFSFSIAPAFVVAAVVDGFVGALFVTAGGFLIAAALGTLVALAFARKLGGFTGDTLGAAVELGEVAFLLSYATIGAIF
ncbi:MAG: adenosylcobinamide-GDP ribazoletransferase [Spirochaetes bacterium]|nr:adenosylcobinamide-GDP ribazoletransferase [Spirochaetota bacterium]